MNFLIYGANGYTGQLIVEKALARGLRPVIAGRNGDEVRALAERTGLDFRVFSISESDDFLEKEGIAAREGFAAVVHCAGPFLFTGRQMMAACLRSGLHYFDITGEFPVFEQAQNFGKKFEEKGLTIMPGIGFDIVPTDCLALFLSKKMPDAVRLELAFAQPGGQLSRGTQKSMTNKLGDGGMIRKNGKLTPVPLGHRSQEIEFLSEKGPKKLFTMAIPWGDVATAFWTTGIPNIEVFTSVHPKTHSKLRWQGLFNWILKLGFVKKMALRRIQKGPSGPDEARRKKAVSMLWGRVENEKGERIEARFRTPNGYSLTAETAVLIVEKTLAGHFCAGFQTPAGCFGENLIHEIEGVSPFVLTDI